MPKYSKNWKQHYEIIYDIFCKDLFSKNIKPTIREFCKFLDITLGKRQKWEQGQWPSAEDLETLHNKMGFSYRWLVTGEGDMYEAPQPVPPAKGTEAQPVIQAKLAELEQELREANRLNRQLTSRLFMEGAGDKAGSTNIDHTADGQK